MMAVVIEVYAAVGLVVSENKMKKTTCSRTRGVEAVKLKIKVASQNYTQKDLRAPSVALPID